MKPWKVILAAVLLFAAGVATGAAGARIRTRATVRAELAKRGPLPPIARQRFDFLRRAQRDLNLSEAQKARIDAKVKASQDRFRKLWEPISPQARMEFDLLREQIREELSPEQQQRFDQLLKKAEKERRRSRDTNSAPAP